METKTSNDARPRENSGLANSTRTYSAQRERKRKKKPEHIRKGNYGTTIDFSRTSCPWRLHSLRMSLYCVHAQTMVAAHRLLSRRLRGTLHPLRRISCVVIASVVSVQSHPCRQHIHVQHSISIAFETTRPPEGSVNHDGLLGSHNQSIVLYQSNALVVLILLVVQRLCVYRSSRCSRGRCCCCCCRRCWGSCSCRSRRCCGGSGVCLRLCCLCRIVSGPLCSVWIAWVDCSWIRRHSSWLLSVRAIWLLIHRRGCHHCLLLWHHLAVASWHHHHHRGSLGVCVSLRLRLRVLRTEPSQAAETVSDSRESGMTAAMAAAAAAAAARTEVVGR